MKELNDDMDHLFRKVIEPLEENPSTRVWNSLDNRLNRIQLAQYKRLNSRYKLLSLSLFILLLALGGFELINHAGLGKNNSASIAFLDRRLPVEEIPMYKKETFESAPNVLQANKKNSSFTAALPLQRNPLNNTESSVFDRKTNPLTSGKQKDLPQSKIRTHVAAAPNLPPLAASLKREAESPGAGIGPGLEGKSEEQIKKINEEQKNRTHYEPLISIPGSAIGTLSCKENSEISENGRPVLASTNQDKLKFQHFSIIGFYSPELTNRLLTKDHDADDSKKVNDDDYKEREVAGFSYTSGLKAGYAFNSQWSVFAGLGFFSVSQRISPLTVYAQTGTDGGQHFVMNTSSGSAELPGNTGQVLTKNDSLMVNSSSQVLKFINIPLTIQYSKVMGRLSVYAFSGFSFNYLISQKLIVELPNSSGADQYSITTLNGVHKLNLGFVAGVGAGYALSNSWSLHLEPGLKASLTPINSNTAVKSYPYSFGLLCGLGYHF